MEPADNHPKDLWLYLDGEYQLFSAVEAIYHEWFVHGAVQARGSPPCHALVLGGGDGLVVRELVKYSRLERLVHVELDREMLRLRREHPALAALNDNAYDDPRVETVVADAFEWVRRSRDTFDAIFIDMPLPKDYNLSKVYSREFYAAVRARLAPGGVLVVDAPDSLCTDPESDWDRYRSTVAAAGFGGIHAMVSRVHPQTARARTLLAELDTMTVVVDRELRELSENAARAALHGSLERAAARIEQNEFILAFHSDRAPHTTWREMGVPLRVFGPEQLPLAFVEDCPRYADASLVNSVVRPTLPRLVLDSMRIR
jgi:predicted membrane-bound spermidine synthase